MSIQKDKTIKFLSIVGPDTKTSYGIMSQMHLNCDMDKHKFFVLATDNCRNRFPKLYEFPDLMFMPKNKSRLGKIKYFYDLLNRSEHIIFHSLYFTSYKFTLFLFVFRKFLKKAVWVEWGADLYSWKFPETSLKNRLKNKIGHTLRNNMGSVAFTFPINEKIYYEQFSNRPKTFYTPMPNPMPEPTGLMDKIDSLNPEFLKLKKEKLKRKLKRKYPKRRILQSVADKEVSVNETNTVSDTQEPAARKVRIQIAHNSFSFNHHVKLLNFLSRFKEENIDIKMPMSYGVFGINGAFGGKDYIDCVGNYGKEVFGDKLDVMTVNIPFEEYVQYLWTVDIAVFDFNRPCGLGNIRILLYMGKKIFLPAENEFYKFLTSKGVKIYDTNQIPNMTYEEFIAPPENNDLTWIKDYLNNASAIQHWQTMFDELEKGEI